MVEDSSRKGCLFGLVLWPVAEVVELVHRASYWLRPYDMIADSRRWRWQQREPCGRQTVETLRSHPAWPEVEAAAERYMRGRP